jgi:hypothetical protein
MAEWQEGTAAMTDGPPNEFHGLCHGGPWDGQWRTCAAPYLNSPLSQEPLLRPPKPGKEAAPQMRIGYATYVFQEPNRWILK